MMHSKHPISDSSYQITLEKHFKVASRHWIIFDVCVQVMSSPKPSMSNMYKP